MEQVVLSFWGTKWTKSNLWGIGIILFSVITIGINQMEKVESEKVEKAFPVSKKTKDFPIYITGEFKSKEISSEFVKSGKYILIEQYSEVYAWNEVIASKGRTNATMYWIESPIDPKTFKDSEFRDKPLATKKLELKKSFDKDLLLIDDSNQSYKVDLSSSIDWNYSFNFRPLKAEELIYNSFTHIGASTEQFKDATVLYEDKECEVNPRFNCQRVILKVLELNEKVTLIGDIEGDKIIPFNDRIIIGKGDYENVIDQAYIGSGINYFIQFFNFILAGFGFYILSEDLKKIPYLFKLPALVRYLGLGVSVGLITIYTIKIFFVTLILLLVGFYYLTNVLPKPVVNPLEERVE
jgi:hypothetical protein